MAALDLIRDRERGVPRYNEFRRQYGLTHLTGFDDFMDQREKNSKKRKEQEELVKTLREVYGQHRCDAWRVRTSQLGIGYGSWPWQFLFDGFVWGSMRLIIEKIGFG